MRNTTNLDILHITHNPPECPRCLAVLSGATHVEQKGAIPKPGDFSMCFYCLAFLTVTHDYNLREVDDAEIPVDLLRKLQGIKRTAIQMRKEQLHVG